MVANTRTGQGIFTEADGRFILKVQRTDTIVIRAFGYQLRKISFADSTVHDQYDFIVPLFHQSIQLREFTFKDVRPADSVLKDIQHLGYNQKDYMLNASEAFMSPITALYQEFSKKERSKRKVAELLNDDKRKSLIIELLYYYYRNGIINLDPSAFEDFTAHSSFNDELLKSFTAYELAVYIKNKIALYQQNIKMK